jgi:hypothetical protein
MNFTAAELRELADHVALYVRNDMPDFDTCKKCMALEPALREYADLKEAAEKGVTDEVLRPQFERFCRNQCSPGALTSEWYWMIFKAGAFAVAPLLALKGDKP